jgi:protein TonB
MSQSFVKVAREPVKAMLLDMAKPTPEPPPSVLIPPSPPLLRTKSPTPPALPAPVPPMETVVAPSVPAAAAITAIAVPTQATSPLSIPTAVGPSQVPTPVAAAPAAPVAKPVERTPAEFNEANCEERIYPAISIRRQEEGTVYLRLLVGRDGQVLKSSVEKSSGYMRLDEAARARLSKCKLKPATVGGIAVETWESIPYTWRLE